MFKFFSPSFGKQVDKKLKEQQKAELIRQRYDSNNIHRGAEETAKQREETVEEEKRLLEERRKVCAAELEAYAWSSQVRAELSRVRASNSRINVREDDGSTSSSESEIRSVRRLV